MKSRRNSEYSDNYIVLLDILGNERHLLLLLVNMWDILYIFLYAIFEGYYFEQLKTETTNTSTHGSR